MDDRLGNTNSQIERLRGGLTVFDGESSTELKEAIVQTEKASDVIKTFTRADWLELMRTIKGMQK